TTKLHEYTAQLFFTTAKAEVALLNKNDPAPMRDWFLDAIAFIHLLNLPVAEPERLKTAHAHLLAVIAQSRESWAAIRAETDDDAEWLPNANQRRPAIPGSLITEEMVTKWFGFLEELEAILKGEKLV